jgi:hypothetical protein
VSLVKQKHDNVHAIASILEKAQPVEREKDAAKYPPHNGAKVRHAQDFSQQRRHNSSPKN